MIGSKSRQENKIIGDISSDYIDINEGKEEQFRHND